MNSQIPADKVRDLRDQYARLIEDAGTKETQAYYGHVVKDLDALLPAPPLPTLADMTEEERAACQWMQADVYSFDRRMVITEVRTMSADLIERDGERWNVGLERVTPRPDLPRLTWPSDTDAAPAPAPALPDGWRLAYHQTLGRVIVTSASTSSDGDGYVYILFPDDDSKGYDWVFCPTNRLTFLDTDN